MNLFDSYRTTLNFIIDFLLTRCWSGQVKIDQNQSKITVTLPGIHPIITKQLLTVYFNFNLRQATNWKFASSWKLLGLYEIWLDLVPDLSGFYLYFLFQNCVLEIGSDRKAIKIRIGVIQRYQRVLLYVQGMNSYSTVW